VARLLGRGGLASVTAEPDRCVHRLCLRSRSSDRAGRFEPPRAPLRGGPNHRRVASGVGAPRLLRTRRASSRPRRVRHSAGYV